MTSFGFGAPVRRLLSRRPWICVVVWSVGIALTAAQPCFGDLYQDPTPPAGQYTFYPPLLWGVAKPGSLAIGDIGGPIGGPNGSLPDGWLDVVFLNYDPEPYPPTKLVSVLRNTQNWRPPTTQGLTYPPTTYSLDLSDFGLGGLIPSRMVLADMDNDGDLDIVVSMSGPLGCAVVILRNDGRGNFQVPTFPSPDVIVLTVPGYGLNHAEGLAVANFDVDTQNLPDILVVGHTFDEQLRTVPEADLIHQTAPGAFGRIDRISFLPDVGYNVATDVVAGRFDYFHNPSWPDAYVSFNLGTGGTTSDVLVVSLINNGPPQGGFTHRPALGVLASAIAAGPLRGLTSYMDAAEGLWLTPTGQDGSGYAYLNLTGDGTLTQQQPNWLRAWDPFGVSMGTIDSGGQVDVALACMHGGPWYQSPWSGDGCAAVMFNLTGSTFDHVIRYNVDPTPGHKPAPQFIKVADLNRDGLKDLITVCPGSSPYQLSVLIQQPPATNAPMGPEDFSWDDTEGPFR